MTSILILLAAIFNLGFGLFHLLFWRLFDWRDNLASLKPVNRAIVPVLNLALTFMFMMVGILLIVSPAVDELLIGMTLFWLFRAALQPIWFGLGHWLSKLMFVLFIAGAVLHPAAWWN